jgi:hypothetical protein
LSYYILKCANHLKVIHSSLRVNENIQSKIQHFNCDFIYNYNMNILRFSLTLEWFSFESNYTFQKIKDSHYDTYHRLWIKSNQIHY